jgi:LysR family hydrogen peroxide-inducible transcriptional activator
VPSLTQLEYLVAVHAHGHFGKAAEACHVSQPSLSAQVQKAEDEMGFAVFDRSRKPILTTPLGLKVIKQAQIVLQEYEKLSEISNELDEVAGEYKLGVIPTLSPSLIPLFVESFAKQYPKVSLIVKELKTHEVIDSLKGGGIDGALVVTPLNVEGLNEFPLFYEPFYVFTSKNHELYKRKMVKDVDLDTKSIWLLEEGHCFRDQVLSVCAFKKNHPPIPNIQFQSGSLETLIGLIRKGSGYTLLPYLATSALTSSEKKSQLKNFSAPVPTREVSLVSAREHYKQNIARALMKTVQDSLPKELKLRNGANQNIIPIES